MNHPTREEWMSYLYDESTGHEHASLSAHLAVCPQCQTSFNQWRGLKRDLDDWHLPARIATRTWHGPLLRWVAAATIIASVGVGVGRLSAPSSASADQVRAAIEPSLHQQVRQEFAQLLREELDKSSRATVAASEAQTKELVGDLARANEQNRINDNRAVYAALNKLEAQRLTDFTALKRDLDTVAVYSEAGLRQTQRQLVQLANYAEPTSIPSDLPHN